MNAGQINKREIRRIILSYRALLSQNEFERRNELLLNNIKNLLAQGSYSHIHTFLSIEKNREPDVSPLFQYLWDKGINVIVSKTDFQAKKLDHYYLDKHSKLTVNNYGIPEPINGKSAAIEEADLILVPLLLADKHGNRIGYGGGFYDELLKQTNALKIGLSLSYPVDLLLQKEEWDIPVDRIISHIN